VELPPVPAEPAAAEPAPGAEPTPVPATPPAPDAALPRRPGRLARLRDWLQPAAFAAPAPLPAPGPESSPLDGFAPRLRDLDDYLPAVGALLREASAAVSGRARLDAEQRTLLARLTLAAAWQESCWRQYVRRRGQVTPLRSSVGAVGLMQVNPHVWRGFYATDGLAWSIVYNARAGSEILLHYLRDYAIARGEEVLGGPDALARAAYAAYHGGPSHLRRYRQPKRWGRALVAVDRAFHDKYREVVAGRELSVRSCFAG
jgi:soluble lytic murein transglycosylase-like protein